VASPFIPAANRALVEVNFQPKGYAAFLIYTLLGCTSIYLPLIFLTNLVLRRKLPSNRMGPYCTSVLLQFGAHVSTDNKTAGCTTVARGTTKNAT
jgi:hypothetical protein